MGLQSKTDGTKKTAYATLMDVLQKEGVVGLFGGLDSAILGTAVAQFVYYYWYELLRSIFSGNGKRILSVSENLIVGSIAGAITATATNPIWLVNARMTASKDKSLTSVQCLQQLIKEDGLGGMFKGVGPGLLLVSNPTIQYGAYEQMKVFVEVPDSNGKIIPLTPLQVFYLGAIAKAIATVLTYPLQIIKTKLFVQRSPAPSSSSSSSSTSPSSSPSQDSFFTPVIKLYKEEGISGFFNGLETKITQSVLTAAFLFLFKDQFLIYTVRLLSTLAPSMLIMPERK